MYNEVMVASSPVPPNRRPVVISKENREPKYIMVHDMAALESVRFELDEVHYSNGEYTFDLGDGESFTCKSKYIGIIRDEKDKKGNYYKNMLLLESYYEDHPEVN